MRAAKLAAAALALKRQSGATPPFSLAFLTDHRRAPHPLLAARALPRGAALILRDYDRRNRAALAAQLKTVCSARGVLLIVGADVALAEKIGADGVHVPSWQAPPRRDGAPEMLLTAACHSSRGLERAHRMGADLALLSPAYATASHPGAAALGPQKFQALAASSPLPVLALGGVDETNAAALTGPNVAGLAAIGAFFGRR